MPILDVEMVGPVSEDVRRNLARRIADTTGGALGSPPHGTWVKVRFLDADAYSENEGGPPRGVQPVFASILQAEPPQGKDLSEQASRVAAAIAEACDRPVESIHIIFEPPVAGRIFFGGKSGK